MDGEIGIAYYTAKMELIRMDTRAVNCKALTRRKENIQPNGTNSNPLSQLSSDGLTSGSSHWIGLPIVDKREA